MISHFRQCFLNDSGCRKGGGYLYQKYAYFLTDKDKLAFGIAKFEDCLIVMLEQHIWESFHDFNPACSLQSFGKIFYFLATCIRFLSYFRI